MAFLRCFRRLRVLPMTGEPPCGREFIRRRYLMKPALLTRTHWDLDLILFFV